MNQPNSDDKSVGGITDDAGEREEHGKLLGKAKHGEILKSSYAGGSKALEMGVSIATYYLGSLTHSIVSEQIHSLACIIPTTSVTSFPSSHTSTQTWKTWKGDIHLINLPCHLQSDFTTKFMLCFDWTSFTMQTHRTATFTFSFFLTLKPCTI